MIDKRVGVLIAVGCLVDYTLFLLFEDFDVLVWEWDWGMG